MLNRAYERLLITMYYLSLVLNVLGLLSLLSAFLGVHSLWLSLGFLAEGGVMLHLVRASATEGVLLWYRQAFPAGTLFDDASTPQELWQRRNRKP